jgi:hypothetical protein
VMECEHTSGTLNLAWNASLGSKRKREELYLDIGLITCQNSGTVRV